MVKNSILKPRSMLSILIVLIMVLTGFVGLAGAAEENSEKESEAAGAIVGKVVTVDGDPLAGAIVYLSSVKDNTNANNLVEDKQETNERGYFEFKPLREGAYGIRVVLDGYEGWGEQVKVPSGKTIELKVVLKKAETEPEPEVKYGVVFGIVYNALNNKPIGGAIVHFYNEVSSRPPEKVETNDDGEFKVRLPRGKYVMEVEARGFEPYKEELIVKGGDKIELKIGLRPIFEEPPNPEPRPRPMLSGHIYDAKTDKPIFGWVEITKGEPKVQPEPKPCPKPKPKKWVEVDEDKEKDWDKKDWDDKDKDNNDENMPNTRAEDNNERPDDNKKYERPEPKPDDPNQPEKPERPDEPDWDKKYDKPDWDKPCPEQPEDYLFWRTYSNDDGYYKFPCLPPGHYEMRVFSKGHRFYYNEIDVRDKPLYIDVYLLREPQKDPMAFIYGQVVNARTHKPVEGAVVCVIPLDVFHLILKLREANKDKDVDMDALGLGDLDLGELDPDNLEFIDDIEAAYYDLEEDELNKELEDNIDLDDIDFEFDDKDKADWDNSEKTRSVNEDSDNKRDFEREKKNDTDKDTDPDPDQEKEREKDLWRIIKEKLMKSKYCTKTNERGLFRLKIPAGKYVMLVKARGYKLWAHKFVIKPHQKMLIRVPLKPMVKENDDVENATRPQPKDRDNTDKVDDPITETLGMEASTLGAVGTTSSVLNAILSILILIALILGAFVWRKHGITNRLRKKRGK